MTRAALDPVGEAVLLDFCRRTLGPCRLVADRSWPHRQSIVLEVADSGGRGWIVKHCRDPLHHRQEVTAYREWVHALDGLGPSMVAHDDEIGAVLLTLEPGAITTSTDPAIHRRAGALVRKLHGAAAPRPAPDVAGFLADRLDRAVASGGGLFSRADLDLVRARVRTVEALPLVAHVPTHQDNQLRNWLVDRDGTVRLIDFGLSTWDVWVRDLVRIRYWDWVEYPALRDAFLDGYGRELSDADGDLLAALGAVTAVRTVLWARDHGDPSFALRGWRTLEILRAGDR